MKVEVIPHKYTCQPNCKTKASSIMIEWSGIIEINNAQKSTDEIVVDHNSDGIKIDSGPLNIISD